MLLSNLTFAWLWFLTGMIVGTILGIFFHKPDWLGGYNTWPRRMIRLGHIAFLGTGFLNLAFALSLPHLTTETNPRSLEVASLLFIIGGAAMPTVCFLAAWKKPFRHLFFIPAGSLITAATITTLAFLQLQGGTP